MRDLAPTATGWLGSTTGVDPDGTAIMLARFENAAAARANSKRPEQTAWWRETEKLYAGDVEFHDCSTVMTMMEGGSDDAGFVQVIEGTVTDPDKAQALMAESEDVLKSDRPDLVGGLIALHDEDQTKFTEVAYFTSESEARAGERKEPSKAGRRLMEEEGKLLADVHYHDLEHPWLQSPH
jgi:hypothetical protein